MAEDTEKDRELTPSGAERRPVGQQQSDSEPYDPSKLDWQSQYQVPLRASNILAFHPEKAIGSSSDLLSGSITAMSYRIRAVENSLGDLAVSVTRITQGQGREVAEEMDARIKPMEEELSGLKQEVSQLQEVKTSLDRTGGFLKENAPILADAVSATGQFRAMEGRLGSLEDRLRHVEGQKLTHWTRIVSVLSVIIALAGVTVACLSSFWLR